MGQEKDIVLITSLLQTTPLCLTLCLLYPSHPRAFPNTHSFPSNSPTPQTILSPKTKCPTEVVRGWGSFQGAFFVQISPFFIGCNDLPLDLKILLKLAPKVLTDHILQYLRAPRLAVRPGWPEPILFWKFGKDVINYYLSLE